jgi:hypothetical protein
VHCEQTMRLVCRTARLTLRYDTMRMLQLLDEKLHHFLSRRYTPACLEVRYRSVALSQAQQMAAGCGGARGYQTDVLLMMMMIHCHCSQTLKRAYQMTC